MTPVARRPRLVLLSRERIMTADSPRFDDAEKRIRAMRLVRPLLFALLLSSVSRTVADDNWTQFRGGAKGGVAEAKTLPQRWSTSENVVWKVDVPGRGWSSPVVWKGQVYLTTVVSEQKLRDPKKGLYINNLQGRTPPGEHRWLVCCFHFKSGKLLWQKEVHKG